MDRPNNPREELDTTLESQPKGGYFDLTDHFLIAMPNMTDPNFAGTVVYVVEHGEKGAMGVVINRPIELSLADLLGRIDLDVDPTLESLSKTPVLLGGPVQNDRGFVLHSPHGQWSSSIRVSDQVALTSSKDVLESVARGTGPEQVSVALGYSGWGAGQLEDEIANNAWLTVKANENLIFSSPVDQRHNLAFGLLGFDPALLMPNAGHA
jgi:putative transcriptional regulator